VPIGGSHRSVRFWQTAITATAADPTMTDTNPTSAMMASHSWGGCSVITATRAIRAAAALSHRVAGVTQVVRSEPVAGRDTIAIMNASAIGTSS
jgi:hypothetical protein